MQFNSIRSKTNILYTFILGIILLFFSIVIYFSADTILYRDLDESLQVKAKEIADIVHAYEQVEAIDNQPLSLMAELLGQGSGAVTKKTIIDDFWRSEVKTLNLKADYINILTAQGAPSSLLRILEQKLKRSLLRIFPSLRSGFCSKI